MRFISLCPALDRSPLDASLYPFALERQYYSRYSRDFRSIKPETRGTARFEKRGLYGPQTFLADRVLTVSPNLKIDNFFIYFFFILVDNAGRKRCVRLANFYFVERRPAIIFLIFYWANECLYVYIQH